jgi:hypothetical protein
MSDCPQCAIAVSQAKAAFNRVVDATIDGRRNILPNGNVDWESFRAAVENSLTYALSSSSRKKK